MSDLDEPATEIQPMPRPGPMFRAGETVAFFPAEVGPTTYWLRLPFAVIEQVDEHAQTFVCHFVGEPGRRRAQGLENVVRLTPDYHEWRSKWEAAYARTRDERRADDEASGLGWRIMFEHPIHGPRLQKR